MCVCVGRGRDSSPQALLSIHGADGADVSVDDATASARSLLDSDLLRQMHRMRHQDHKDEGLNLTRSVLAARASKVGPHTPHSCAGNHCGPDTPYSCGGSSHALHPRTHAPTHRRIQATAHPRTHPCIPSFVPEATQKCGIPHVHTSRPFQLPRERLKAAQVKRTRERVLQDVNPAHELVFHDPGPR